MADGRFWVSVRAMLSRGWRSDRLRPNAIARSPLGDQDPGVGETGATSRTATFCSLEGA